jgi:hypothetical protein
MQNTSADTGNEVRYFAVWDLLQSYNLKQRDQPRKEERETKQSICCNELGWTGEVQNPNIYQFAKFKES